MNDSFDFVLTCLIGQTYRILFSNSKVSLLHLWSPIRKKQSVELDKSKKIA